MYYIQWASSPGATFYHLRKTNVDTGGSYTYAPTSGTTATIGAPGMTQTLQYAVQACNGHGCSSFIDAPNETDTDPPGPIR